MKIRGFRVEPGEVESVLTRHPGIDRAAVVAHEHPAGDRQLIAYVVPSGGARQGFREAELRAYARGVLADYLVPAVFVPLDELPLTPSGKLDRAALPEPGTATAAVGRAAPGGTVATLCELFAQMLHTDRAGPDDDFFARGGHSLLAARLLGRIRGVLGVEIDIRGLFEAPTPALLAPFVDTAPPVRPSSSAVPGDASGALPVSHAQHRLWFLDRIGAGAAYNLPMLVRLRGPVDAAALDDALARVAERHEVLRTVFEESDGSPVRRVLSGAAARPPFRQLRTTGDSMDREIEREAGHRFDLRTELPMRATLFTSSERPDEHALLVLVHHIAGDGWSLRPLFRDLSRAYEARVRGADPAGLPRSPSSTRSTPVTSWTGSARRPIRTHWPPVSSRTGARNWTGCRPMVRCCPAAPDAPPYPVRPPGWWCAGSTRRRTPG